MKEKQRIQWRASGQIPKSNGSGFRSIVAEAILDAVTALMFLLSARAMLYDIFGWAKFSVGACFGFVLAAACVSGAMGLSGRCRGKVKRLVRGGVLLGGLLGFALYCFGSAARSELIGTGIGGMRSQFVEFWNIYYNKEIPVGEGVAQNIPAALNVSLLLIGFVLLWLAKRFDRKIILGILPGSVLGAVLLVGYAPKIGALLFLVFGVALCNVFRFKLPEFHLFPGKEPISEKLGSFSWLPVFLAVILAGSLLANVAAPLADAMIANAWGVRRVLQQWVGEPGGEANGLEDPFGNANNSIIVELSNEKPEFSNITVISLSMDKAALRNVYLKAFSAGKYTGGSWEADIASFESYFREKGYDPAQVSEAVLKREVDALAKAYGVQQIGQSAFGSSMRIQYLVYQVGRMALPYFTDFAESDAMQTVGESYYTRVQKMSSLPVDVWDYKNRYQDDLSLFENPDSPLVDWGYDAYVQAHYLAVPECMDTVTSLAETLNSGKVANFTGSENELRLYKAKLVAEWLEENTNYSLDLPALPEGEDAIEYFLRESKAGYCMHYASAAALVLRQMDVPVRIATGYLVQKSEFAKVEKEYLAQVEDNQAHAWVEVYLDGLGWFPVEVTKGYRTADSLSPPGNSSVVDPGDVSDETDPTEEIIEEEEIPEEPLDGIDVPVGGKDSQKRARFIMFLGGFALLVAAGALAVLKWKQHYWETLRKLINRQKMALAIFMMNRRIYRKLRITGKVIRLHLRDDGYEALLKEHYPEIPEEAWERYMELVKAAAFSQRAFSNEEVAFCYEIYRKVKPHG